MRIHLLDTYGGTLCGILRMSVQDHNARTGWPDCSECIKKTEPPKPEVKPSWQA